MNRSHRGFTLVELLAVITILGILMALLIPGVNLVRENGRQTACLNNQMQIGKAIIAYETTKNHLPGVLNPMSVTGGTIAYNWVEALFPYLERADMWGTISTGNTAAIAALQNERLKVTVCPNDPYALSVASSSGLALLSYGVNDSYFVSNLPAATTSPPVDRYGTAVARAVLSKLTCRPNTSFPGGESVTPSTIIMLGERTGDGTSNYPRQGSPAAAVYPSTVNPPTSPPNYLTAGKWTDSPSAVPSISVAACWNSLTFAWPPVSSVHPPAPAALNSVLLSPNIMVSAHPGKVIVIFFDCHGAKVPNDTTFFPTTTVY